MCEKLTTNSTEHTWTFTHSFNQSINHSFNKSFIYSFIHSIKQSINQSFIQSFIHSFNHSFNQTVKHSFNHSFIQSINHSIIHPIIRSFNHSFIQSINHSFIQSIIHSIIHSFIHSFRSLPYDRPTASSKTSSPHSASYCFYVQFPVPSHFVKVIQQLLMSSSPSFRHFYPSLHLSFNNVFQKAVPRQDVTKQVSLPPFDCRTKKTSTKRQLHNNTSSNLLF